MLTLEQYDKWRFAEALRIYNLGTNVPKKGKKMNVELNTPEIELTPEQTAKLAELALALEANGEALIQTEEQLGSETPETRTVH